MSFIFALFNNEYRASNSVIIISNETTVLAYHQSPVAKAPNSLQHGGQNSVENTLKSGV